MVTQIFKNPAVKGMMVIEYKNVYVQFNIAEFDSEEDALKFAEEIAHKLNATE